MDEQSKTQDILDYLKSDNYIAGKQIIKHFSIKNGYILRKIINRLRQEGYPIIAGKKGYRLTQDIDEIFIYSESLKNRILNQKKAYEGLFKYIQLNHQLKDFI